MEVAGVEGKRRAGLGLMARGDEEEEAGGAGGFGVADWSSMRISPSLEVLLAPLACCSVLAAPAAGGGASGCLGVAPAEVEGGASRLFLSMLALAHFTPVPRTSLRCPCEGRAASNGPGLGPQLRRVRANRQLGLFLLCSADSAELGWVIVAGGRRCDQEEGGERRQLGTFGMHRCTDDTVLGPI